MLQRIQALAILMAAAVSAASAAEGMTTVESRYDVDETTERLVSALNDAGMNVFGEVPHSEGASSVDMELPPTRVVIFGNPEIGTVLMQCDRSVGIDLPMKALIWEEGGTTYIGYNSADYLARRHGLEGCEQPLEKVAGALERFAGEAAGR